MKKFDYLFTSIIIFAIIVSSISFGMTLEANEKLDNVNTNFQNMKEIFFQNQIGNQKYNCLQDFDIRESNDIEYIKNLNQKTQCLMKIDVSLKIYKYQELGIEPTFSDNEVAYIENILTQTNVPIFEQMLQFKSEPELTLEDEQERALQELDDLILKSITNSTD
jgi:hypothetical protein